MRTKIIQTPASSPNPTSRLQQDAIFDTPLPGFGRGLRYAFSGGDFDVNPTAHHQDLRLHHCWRCAFCQCYIGRLF